MYAPVSFVPARAVQKDVVLCDYHIPAGTLVSINSAGLHRDERYWVKPNEFRPERWVNPEEVRRRNAFAWLPFSGGPRVCIGNKYVQVQLIHRLAFPCWNKKSFWLCFCSATKCNWKIPIMN